MPTIKITKPQSQKPTTKPQSQKGTTNSQSQVVNQLVKVVLEAPKKKIRRKRRVAKAISKAASKITEQLPIYTPFYIAQPSTSQPSNVQTSAESLTATAFNPALDKVNNMRIEENKKRGGLSTTAISLNDILPSAPQEVKELEPSKPEKGMINIPKGGAPEKHESGLNKSQMISKINEYNRKNNIVNPTYTPIFKEQVVNSKGKTINKQKEKSVEEVRIIFNEYVQQGFI